MSDETRRIIIKKGAGVPTIPTSVDHRDGSWLATDIYEGEFYLDTANNQVYTNINGVATSLNPTSALAGNNFVFVFSKNDFPPAVSNVITLDNEVTYFITTTIDLTGDRLVGGTNNAIIGGSSESCILKSTGLSSGTALITSVYSLPMRNITITHGTALNLDGDGTTTALDWFGVNFTDCATIGTIKDYTNFIMGDSAFLNSQGLTFDGTIGTIGMSNCLFDCRA